MGVPVEFYIYVGYGLFAMVVVVAIMNFFLGGFLGPFMRVKRSRGAKLLVRVRHPIQDYFRAGSIDEGFLVYEDREKNTRRISMAGGMVSRAAGVFWIETDDVKNCLFRRDSGEAVSTFDAVKYDELYKRTLYKPPTLGDNLLKFVLILSIVAVLAVAVVGYMTYRTGSDVKLVLSLVQVARNATMGVV